ncbi:MAG: hypothetical protein LBT24_07020, partial [Tannerella sp.]|nr:hypothetical protein [Tannerella sp.]
MKRQNKKRIESQSWSQQWIKKLNDFFGSHEKTFMILSMVLSLLMCIFLFDVKVSLSGDDCDYLVNADN